MVFPKLWLKEETRHNDYNLFLVLLEGEGNIFHKIVSSRLVAFRYVIRTSFSYIISETHEHMVCNLLENQEDDYARKQNKQDNY